MTMLDYEIIWQTINLLVTTKLCSMSGKQPLFNKTNNLFRQNWRELATVKNILLLMINLSNDCTVKQPGCLNTISHIGNQ